MKKIRLQESQLWRLFEDHRQLKLPFERGDAAGYDHKANYEHFVDWLESVGKYGTLGASGIDKDGAFEMANSSLEEAFMYYIDVFDAGEQICRAAIDAIFKEAYEASETDKYFKLSDETVEEAVSCYSLADSLEGSGDVAEVSDYYNFLTKDGAKKFGEESTRNIWDTVVSYGLDITMDDRGLIYVEREISLPQVFNTRYDTAFDPDKRSYFDHLSKTLNGVGVCWSWLKGGGEAYCADRFSVGTCSVLLVGWVSPKGIDWAKTLAINAYMENSETELRLLQGAVVEVDKVVYDGKNMLSKPILVKA